MPTALPTQRLPISKTSKINSIYGIIYQKEFYEMLINDEQDLKSIIASPIITKPNIKISRLLKTLQKEHQHMAFVQSKNKIICAVALRRRADGKSVSFRQKEKTEHPKGYSVF